MANKSSSLSFYHSGNLLRFLIFLFFAGFPATASANSGTPFIWAGVLHLFAGNILIGMIEGYSLGKYFKASLPLSIISLIAANYASAWAGFWLCGFLSPILDLTLENIRLFLLLSLPVIFLFTVIIEFPFVVFVLRSSRPTFLHLFKATLLINLTTYVLLVIWYTLAGNTSLVTQTHIVAPQTIKISEPLTLYYISSDNRQLMRKNLSDNTPSSTPSSTLTSFPATDKNTSLFTRKNSADSFDLLLTDGETEQLLLPHFSPKAIAHPKKFPHGILSDFGSVPSLDDSSPWSFRTGFWSAEGITSTNANTTESFHLAMETHIADWNIRNAIQISRNLVIFQLGKDQICLFDAETRNISLLTRGHSPLVAYSPTDH